MLEMGGIPGWMWGHLADTAHPGGLRGDGTTAELPPGFARVVEHSADHDQVVRGADQFARVRPAVPTHPHTEVFPLSGLRFS
jgi:hypothetical protein